MINGRAKVKTIGKIIFVLSKIKFYIFSRAVRKTTVKIEPELVQLYREVMPVAVQQ